MQTIFNAGRQNKLIYLVIIISFLLVLCIVWWFFGSKIEAVETKKKDQLLAKMIMKEKKTIYQVTSFYKP